MSDIRSAKIAIIGPSAPPAGGGGVASSHYQLYRCFRNRGLNAVLLTFNERDPDQADSEILRFGASERERKLLAFCCALYLKACGSRKVAYHLADIFCSIPGMLRMNRVLRQLEPDHIIIPDHGAPGLFLDKGKAHLTLVTHHNPARFASNPLLGDFCPVDVREAVSLEQRVLVKVDGVIAPSRYMEGVFRDTFSYDRPVTTIPNPLNAALIEQVKKNDSRHELGLPPGAPMVYIPSAGSVLKGERFVALIIRCLSAAAGGMIGFYLSGGLSADLTHDLRTLPENARVLAPGHLDYCANLALVKSCDFGVSPTLIESFGMAILEASFCGLPMVVFEVGGNAEIISDGINGFCVPCPDVERLVASAARLLDPRCCREMGQAACRIALERFDAEKIVDRYLEFLQVENTKGSKLKGGRGICAR